MLLKLPFLPLEVGKKEKKKKVENVKLTLNIFFKGNIQDVPSFMKAIGRGCDDVAAKFEVKRKKKKK